MVSGETTVLAMDYVYKKFSDEGIQPPPMILDLLPAPLP
ncbi:hypothetical protein D082_25600 [Synechocystis sp. PCC 6714]|nr:hypothetical protein D082_25600 [Synechocystis sp. PCC 6714]